MRLTEAWPSLKQWPRDAYALPEMSHRKRRLLCWSHMTSGSYLAQPRVEPDRPMHLVRKLVYHLLCGSNREMKRVPATPRLPVKSADVELAPGVRCSGEETSYWHRLPVKLGRMDWPQPRPRHAVRRAGNTTVAVFVRGF
jgi:hypothetical protein